MFASFYLKRVLPFALTFLVGAALGGLFNYFGSARRAGFFHGPRVYRDGRRCRTSPPPRVAPDRTVRAAITFQPSPRYTEEALRNNYRGQARLRLLLGADGRVKLIEPLDRLPYGLTEEAIRAAEDIKFTPATRDGAPVDMWAYVEQDFVEPATMRTITQGVDYARPSAVSR
jgi:hypothetical protein